MKAIFAPNALMNLYRNHLLNFVSRQEYEKFVREAKAVSKHLDTQISNLSRQLKKQKDLTPDDLMKQREHLLLTVIQSPEKLLTQGKICHLISMVTNKMAVTQWNYNTSKNIT